MLLLHRALLAVGGAAPAGVTYATWSTTDKSSNIVLSNGNLTARGNDTGWCSVRASIGKTSGKWYWEVTHTITSGVAGPNRGMVGIMDDGASLSNYLGASSKSGGVQHGGNYNWYVSGLTATYTGAVGTIPDGTVFGFAMDVDAGKIWISKDGSWVNGDPTGAEVWQIGADTWFPAVSGNESPGEWTANFGASAFSYSVPSGFNAGVYT